MSVKTTRELIDAAQISRLQINVLIVCCLTAMVEGYDLLTMSLAVVPLSDAWGLTGTQTGVLLSMGPAGMVVGAVGLSALSDRFGRRPVLIASLVIVTVFVGLSATASGVTDLAVFRAISGIGMGGVMPLLTITLSEFAPARRRTAAIGIGSVGVPLGSAVGGAGAAALLAGGHWSTAFVLGAVLTAFVVVLVVMTVPESPDFLETRNTIDAGKKLSKVLDRMGIDPAADPGPTAAPAPAAPPGRELTAQFAIRSWQTAVIVVMFVLVAATYYFSNMWLPTLLVMAGMSPTAGFSGVLLLSLGSAASGLVIAVLSARVSLVTLIVSAAVVSAMLLAIFSVTSSHLTLALVVAPLLGLAQCATNIGVQALVPSVFGAENRSAALGLCLGISRIGTIVMPLGIGALIDMSWRPESIFQLMIVPTLLTAALVYVLRYGSRDESAHLGRTRSTVIAQ